MEPYIKGDLIFHKNEKFSWNGIKFNGGERSLQGTKHKNQMCLKNDERTKLDKSQMKNQFQIPTEIASNVLKN